MQNQTILEMKDISKSFPGVQALNKVSFNLKPGEVHVLIGENGAGKSTMMKILAGIYQKDSGEILLHGEPLNIHNPKEALSKGISMIHQELSPIPYMSVAENILLGREPVSTPLKILNRKEMRRFTRELLDSLSIPLDPDTLMSELSVAETQMMEIAKATSFNSSIIIMDEPTSAISDTEVDILFNLIRSLKDRGKSIVYISHKLDEIFRISDRITVLRDGGFVASEDTGNMNQDKLINLMVGREISEIFPKEESSIGNVLLEVEDLECKGAFKGVSFTVKKGEILGIAGLMGAGRTEVVETIFGIRNKSNGTIKINGSVVNIESPADAIQHGMAFIPEDRKNFGLILKRSVKENITLLKLKYFSRFLVIQKRRENKAVDNSIKILGIKTPRKEQNVANLSGGNQQKVVIAKWLLAEPDILILDEPTRGIDVGSKAEIHKLISQLAVEGKAVIMVSSELPEIMGMSDRVIIMHDGQLTGELPREKFTQERIMRLATNQINEGTTNE